jgi:hypothetical protein
MSLNVPLLVPGGSKTSAKQKNKRRKSLWGKMKKSVLTESSTPALANTITAAQAADLYVDLNVFNHQEYELDDAYYQSAYLLAHAPSGQHLNQRFDYGSRRVYNIIHSTWFQYYVYSTLAIVHCALGLYSSEALSPFRSYQLILEWGAIVVYLVDVWLIKRLALEDDSQRVTPKTRHATLQSGIGPTLQVQPLSRWNDARLVCVVLFIVDLVCFMCVDSFKTPRYTTFLRPMVLVLRLRNFRQKMRAVMWSATHIGRVFIIISFHVIFSGFVAFILFSEGASPGSPFLKLSTSILEMLLVLTSTGNVFKVMEIVYAPSDGFGTLFFVIFVVIGKVLLFKIVVATAYRSFKGFMKKELIRAKRNRTTAIATAFDMVTDDGTMDSGVWRRLYVEMALQNRETFQQDLWGEVGCGCCLTCLKGNVDALVAPTNKTFRTSIFSEKENTRIRLSADAIFRTIDADQSGLLEYSEFKQGIRMVSNVIVRREQEYQAARSTVAAAATHGKCWHCGYRWWVAGQKKMACVFTYEVSTFIEWVKAKFGCEQDDKVTRMFREFDLDGSGDIDWKEFQDLAFACGDTLTDEQAKAVVLSLDSDGDGTIGVDEFRVWFKGDPDDDVDHDDSHSKLFLADVVVDLIVVMSCISIYYHTVESNGNNSFPPHVHGDQQPPQPPQQQQQQQQQHLMVTPHHGIWDALGNVALGLFVVEIFMRVYAFGFKKYIAAPMHVLDVTCASVGGFFFILNLFNSGTNGNNALYNLSLVLRSSRMLRLLWFVPSLQGMLWTIAMLLPNLLELLSILFLPMYIFGCLGHLFFGECMVADPSFYNHSLTPMHDYRNNTHMAKWLPIQNMVQFDSPGRGLLMMFGTATTAFWNTFMDAGSVLCSNWGSPLYFYAVRIVLNMIFVPIIAGYILNTFITKYMLYEKKEKEKEDEIKKAAKKKAAAKLVAAARVAEAAAQKNEGGGSGGGGEDGKNNGGGDGGNGEEEHKHEAGAKAGEGKAEQTINKPEKRNRSSQKSLRKHVIDGCHYNVLLKSMNSNHEVENELLGVAADKKERKFKSMQDENIVLKDDYLRLEEQLRNTKRDEIKLISKHRKMELQLQTLKATLLELRSSNRNQKKTSSN